MKLFAIRHITDNKKPTPPYFNDKMKAKEYRKTLGEGYVITPGPDHHKYKA